MKLSGRVSAWPASEKETTMPNRLGKLRAAQNSHALYTTTAGVTGSAQRRAGPVERRNVGTVRIVGRQALAQVHREHRPARHEPANPIFRSREIGTPPGNDGASPVANARARGNDRVGRQVTAGGTFTAAIPNTFTQSADPFDIVPSTWRNGRPSKSAATVTPDLFELAGIRAAEH